MTYFPNLAAAHPTTLHLHADGYPYSEKALRIAGETGKIPTVHCGNKRLYLYENVLSYIREGDVLEPDPEEIGRIRPIRA